MPVEREYWVCKQYKYCSVSSISKPEHNGFIFAYVGPKCIEKGSVEVAVQPKKWASKCIPFGPKIHVFRENESQFFPKFRNTDISSFGYYQDNSIDNLILQY